MYQVIARKYRPQSFDEVVGQEHVKTTLRNAIAQSRIAHGYIFSGQRGTGKTTMARILARCLNCVQGPTAAPCGVCASCTEIAAGSSVDVVEIDAASNRGINEMRELRENVRYQPTRDRYKIFIIDEAHQITSEAFNALLKTIEEPPPWAVFVLCTTEAHKIPATIASRCQHFSFRSVDFEELTERMRAICASEGIEADEDALAVLAQAGEGSVRDSLSALDQAIACSGRSLSATAIRELLGSFSLQVFSRLADSLADASGNGVLELVDEIERNGLNLQHFARETSRFFRNLLVGKISGEGSRLLAASPKEREEYARLGSRFSEEDLTRYLQLSLDLYRDLQFSLQPRFHLEAGLLRLVHAGRLQSLETVIESLPREKSASPETPLAVPVPVPSPTPVRRGLSPFEADRLKKASPPAPPRSSGANALAPEPAALERVIDWRAEIAAGLSELGLTYTADAFQHATITPNGRDLLLEFPEEFKLMANAEEIRKAMERQGLPSVRLQLSFADRVFAAAAAPPAPDKNTEAPVRDALAHPEVQHFRSIFGGEVRAVRDLKE